MVEITPVQKVVSNLNKATTLVYWEDKTDDFDTVGIDVDSGNYDTDSFLDRDYDTRFFTQLSILLENLGPNDVKYTILSTTKDYDDLNADINDADFTEVEKAEATITAGAAPTGSIEITGGPSVKADGTLACVSVVANTFADGDIVCAAVEVGDTVTFNGLEYTAIAGSKAGDFTKFDQAGTNDQCAADLADSITNDVRSGTSGDQTATSSTDTCTGTTDVEGTAGNAITLVSSNGTRLAVTGSGFLTGGIAADIATANGLNYTAVNGAKANDTEFDMSGTDDQTATDLADSIDDDTRTGITVPTIDVTAAAVTNVVTVSAPVNDGAAGNAIDIAGTANITAGGANLTSGVSSTFDSATVNGVPITDGVAIPWRTSDTLTADDLETAINAHTSNPNYTANNVAGVVTITRTDQVPTTNTVTSTTTVMTKTDVNMSGGAKGVSAVTNITMLVPQQTAVRIRCKEASDGSAGKVRGDVKFRP